MPAAELQRRRREVEREGRQAAGTDPLQPVRATRVGQSRRSVHQKGRFQQKLPVPGAPPQQQHALAGRAIRRSRSPRPSPNPRPGLGVEAVPHRLDEAVVAHPVGAAIPHQILVVAGIDQRAGRRIVSPYAGASVLVREQPVGSAGASARGVQQVEVVAQLVGEHSRAVRAHAHREPHIPQSAPDGRSRQHGRAVVVPPLALREPHQRDLANELAPALLRGQIRVRPVRLVDRHLHLSDREHGAAESKIAMFRRHAARPASDRLVAVGSDHRRHDRLPVRGQRDHIERMRAGHRKPGLAPRAQRHHALGIEVDDHLDAGLHDRTGNHVVEGLVQPPLVHRIWNLVRRTHHRGVDQLAVLEEVRVRAGLVVADLVSSDEDPEQGIAPGDQRDAPLQVLRGLVQVDHGRRQPHARRRDQELRASQQSGQLGADPRLAVPRRRVAAVGPDFDHRGPEDLPARRRPRRRSRNGLPVRVEHRDGELSGVPHLDSGALGLDLDRVRNLVRFHRQLGAPARSRRQRDGRNPTERLLHGPVPSEHASAHTTLTLPPGERSSPRTAGP